MTGESNKSKAFTTTSEAENENLFSSLPSAVGAKARNSLSAFTLIELLVVIAIIGILSSVVLAALSGARESARDTRRLQDMRQIQTALEMYYNANGEYPDEDSTPDASGWELSKESGKTFIAPLVNQGYLSSEIEDPINEEETYYRYLRYGASGNWGCDSQAYYVLGVREMESVDGDHSDSPGWSCDDGTDSRDWQSEYDWVTGSYQ